MYVCMKKERSPLPLLTVTHTPEIAPSKLTYLSATQAPYIATTLRIGLQKGM